MKATQKKALVLGGIILLSPVCLMAGFFDPFVIDILQEFNSGQQLIQETEMLLNLQQELSTMQYNIRAFPTRLKTSFQGFTQPFYRPNTGDLFGETGSWRDVMNNADPSYGTVKSGWESSGVSLRPSSLFQNSRINSTGLNSLSHVEVTDAAGINAVQTVNSIRSQQPTNEKAIQALQQNCLAGNNDTAAMQANCAAASGILAAQTGQATNALLAAAVDVNAAQAKTERDREARRVNFESRVLEYQATEPTGVDLSPDTSRNFQFIFGGSGQ